MNRKWLWLLLLWAPLAFSFTLSWVPPTTRVNGDPMADSEIARYDIYCWQDPQGMDAAQYGSERNIGGTSSWTSPSDPDPGNYMCAVTAVDTGGLESDFSDSANFTVAASPPAAPTGVTVTVKGP